jgi:hypothetical protein
MKMSLGEFGTSYWRVSLAVRCRALRGLREMVRAVKQERLERRV